MGRECEECDKKDDLIYELKAKTELAMTHLQEIADENTKLNNMITDLKLRDDTTHVIPLNDMIEHEETIRCICGPRVEGIEGGGKIVVHHSLDGREKTE